MSLFTDELHIHLYGCLTAADVWTLGRDRYTGAYARLNWYADEYEKAYGRRPDPESYWDRDDGLELLTRDFEFTAHGSFPQFQARFNLMIALFPIVPGDTTVLRHVLKTQRERDVRYGEYRCFTPPHLSAAQVTAFVAAAADATAQIDRDSGGAFQPRLAFSISRVPKDGLQQLVAIHTALHQQPERQRVVTGLDFCGVEEGHPPLPLARLYAAIHASNEAEPNAALAILYHVGESFDAMSVMSAMRWVWQAHRMGAHRLGHATALGLDVQALRAVGPVQETVAERLAHLAWLEAEAPMLADHGYRLSLPSVRAEAARLRPLLGDRTLTLAYDDETLEDAHLLQQALLADLASKGAIVESCPSSNLRIGRITDLAHHPLPRLVRAGIRTVIATDDPGIFAVDLAHEEALARRLGLGDEDLQRIKATTAEVRSEQLVRPH